ncbi:MAG TPA: DUF5808 domain-containing protein [Streptosporangiaceae bacterium]|jgi:hypothetical protein|nr:DUF5808 domain-containing protein [Streptosporangiaceae bacterium]
MRKGNAVLAILIGGGLIGAAVAQELRKPAGEREWVGKLGGVVPYDLRPPTLERVIAEWWSPEDPRILMPHSFGVGWGVNVGRLVRLASSPPA